MIAGQSGGRWNGSLIAVLVAGFTGSLDLLWICFEAFAVQEGFPIAFKCNHIQSVSLEWLFLWSSSRLSS